MTPEKSLRGHQAVFAVLKNPSGEGVVRADPVDGPDLALCNERAVCLRRSARSVTFQRVCDVDHALKPDWVRPQARRFSFASTKSQSLAALGKSAPEE
jgi:hypothetical protein